MNRTGLILGFILGIIFGFQSSIAQYTANYQTNIISGVTSNWTGEYYVGSNTFADVLRIENGGSLTNGHGYIGYLYSSSNNSVLVSGGGSTWSNSFLDCGFTGPGNSLVISNGGQVFDVYLFSGGFRSISNKVVVTGTGSFLKSSYMEIGGMSYGNTLVIKDGGKVLGTSIVGSAQPSSNNSVLVTGTGSAWINVFGDSLDQDPDLQIGFWGASNRLVVSDGAQLLVNDSSVIGYYGDNNSVLISGSVWSNGLDVTLGQNGAGNSLTISNGGQVMVQGSGYVGLGSGNNCMLVTGNGSVWSSDYFSMGERGAGNRLFVLDSGQVITRNASIGAGVPFSTESNSNYVRVASGGIWKNDRMYVGNYGSSNSMMVAGGTVLSTNIVIGFSSTLCNNLLQLDSGTIVVTNATHDATLEVRNGKFIFNGGTLQVDRFVMTNPCAQFVRNGGTLILDPNLDTDGDSMPNGWERAYGLDPLNAADANADYDGDGQSDFAEFQAGTNPTNSASAFRIIGITPEGDDLRVAWTMGDGKTNALQSAAGDGGYYTNGFADIFTVTNTVGTVTNYLDVGGATNLPGRFYRIRLVP